MELSSIKQPIRKEAERHVTMTFIKIESSCDSQGGCYNMFDLGYLGVDNDMPEQLSFIPYRKKRNLKLSHKKKYRIRSEKHAKKRIVIESIPSAN